MLCANLGSNNCEIADQLGIDVKTVRKWRGRFSASGMEGLHDDPRSGRPFKFDSGVRHEAFTAVVGDPPEPFAAWSLDLLAKHLVDSKLVGSISIKTLSYWLQTADIKPHRVRGWLNSKDPNFREKRDRISKLPGRENRLPGVVETYGFWASFTFHGRKRLTNSPWNWPKPRRRHPPHKQAPTGPP